MFDLKQYEVSRDFILHNLEGLIKLSDAKTLNKLGSQIEYFTNEKIRNTLRQFIDDKLLKTVKEDMNEEINKINIKLNEIQQERTRLQNEITLAYQASHSNKKEYGKLLNEADKIDLENKKIMVSLDEEITQLIRLKNELLIDSDQLIFFLYSAQNNPNKSVI